MILIGQVAELGHLLALRGEGDVAFDKILGRNAFTRSEGRVEALTVVAAAQRPGGRLCLAQVLPKDGQRLCQLLDWSALPEELAEAVRQAEQSIYADAADPLVNWDAGDLLADLQAAGWLDADIQVDHQTSRRRISAADLARWFPEGETYEATEDRLSYAQRLAAAGLSPAEVNRVRDLYQRRLRGQVVDWRRTLLYVQASGR